MRLHEIQQNIEKQGDILGVKGRMQSSSYEKENGEKVYKVDVIAERVTFLSSKKKDEPEMEQEIK